MGEMKTLERVKKTESNTEEYLDIGRPSRMVP